MTATTFEALGTYVFVATRQPAAATPAGRLAAGVLADVDRACSRFREDSDLSRVNRHAGTWVEVDPILVAAAGAACDAARQSDGLVHPLLGRTLVQLGYDRDFGLLTETPEPATPATPGLVEPGLVEPGLVEPDAFEPGPFPLASVPATDAWREVGLDPAGAVRIPADTALDLGATGKAWAADLVAAAIAGELGTGAIVSLGGDVAIAEDDGDPWPIAVGTHPGTPAETTVRLDRGGLATSSTRVRRWARRGVQLHHVLDPRSGFPAPTTWRAVTATGPSARAANTATTAAIVLGAQAPAWLSARGVTARLVAADGAVHHTGAWPADTPTAPERRGA